MFRLDESEEEKELPHEEVTVYVSKDLNNSYKKEDKNNSSTSHFNITKSINFLENFAGYNFGGKWSLPSLEDVHRINPEFTNKEGKAKFRLKLEKFTGESNATYIEVMVQLYDGNFINDNTEIISRIELLNDVTNGIIVSEERVDINIGQLFSKPSQKELKCNIRIELNK